MEGPAHFLGLRAQEGSGPSISSFALKAKLWLPAQVAERLAMSPAAFAARRRRLEEDHGFPPPVPGLGRRWDPQAIEAWLARQDRQESASIAGSPEAILLARAEAMRAPGA